MQATEVEGEAEPCLRQAPNTIHERDLPLPIARAITRTMTWRDGEFSQLGLQDRTMLVEVLRCTQKGRPGEGAHIRRDTLAARLNCSLATVTRLLARLEGLGWIVRDQVKSRIRGFQVGCISLTDLAQASLEFGEALPTAQRCAPVSDASDLSRQSLQRQLPQAGGAVETTHSSDSHDKASRVPTSLQWLLGKVTLWGIFKLMGMATKRGFKLEVVTELCRKQISAAENCFAYIKSLLGMDRDWSRLAANETASADASAAVNAARNRLLDDAARIEGRQFIGPDGGAYVIQNGWVVAYSPQQGPQGLGTFRGSSPVNHAFLSALDAGEYRSMPGETQARFAVVEPESAISQPPVTAQIALKPPGSSHAGALLAQVMKRLRKVHPSMVKV